MRKPTTEIVVKVVETVAEALEKPLDEVPPLSEVIDPDALVALMDHRDVTIAFRYADLNVIVQSGGTVYAHPIRDIPEEPMQSGHFAH